MAKYLKGIAESYGVCVCVRRCPDYLPVAPAKTSPCAGLSEMTAVASTVDARSKVSAPEVVICPEGVTVTGKAEVLFTTRWARQGPGGRPHGTDPRKSQGPGAQAWMQHGPPAHARHLCKDTEETSDSGRPWGHNQGLSRDG